MSRLSLLLALALWQGLPALPAFAASPSEVTEAQTRYQRGRELYEEGNFQAALIEFRRAYSLTSNYKLLYNIAQVHYELRDYPGALTSFRRFLSDGGAEVPAARRDEVQKEIEKLVTRVADVNVVTRAGAEIFVDDIAVGKAPLTATVPVSAGRHRVTANLPGHLPVSQVIDVAGMDNRTVELVFTEVAGVVAAAPSSSGRPVWLPFTLGGLAAAAAVGLGVAANGSNSDLKALREKYPVTAKELKSASDNTRNFALASDICTVAAVAAGAVGLWMVLSGPSEPAQPTPTVNLGVSGAGQVTVSGTF